MSDADAAFSCSVCGLAASRLVLLRPGERDPRLSPGDDALTDYDRLSIACGPVSVTLTVGRSDVPSLAVALAAADAGALFALDPELAPFWCPECAASYCADHYRHWNIYDGEFFDCVRGVCPRGHERMLLD